MNYTAYSQLSEQQTRTEALSKELRDEKKVQQELSAQKEKVSKLTAKLKHLEGGIPETAYIATLCTELEKFGKASQVQILQVQPILKPMSDSEKKEASKRAYQEQTISVKGRGSYGDALRFIQGLNQFPKVIAVRTLSLIPRADDVSAKTGLIKLDIDIELRAFVFQDDEKTASLNKGNTDES
jgi:Tfp pilus assembly protein PilO